MDAFLQSLIAGLGAGGLYGLLAIGVVIVYRGSGVINFASGALALIGGATYYELQRSDLHLPVGVYIALGAAAGAAAGALIQVAVMRPLRHASPLVRVIATLAVLAIVQEAGSQRYETLNFAPSFLPGGSVTVGSTAIPKDRLILFILTSFLVAGLYAFYRFSRFGVVTTGVAENERATASQGWSPAVVATANWALGGALSGLAGVFLASVISNSVVPSSMTLTVVPALAAAVVGGVTSFPLTLLGGLLLGALEALSLKYISAPGWPSAVPFLVVIAVLVLRGRSIPLRGYRAARLPAVTGGRINRPVVAIATVTTAASCFIFTPSWASAVVTTMVFAILALSLVVILGYAGQLSLAQVSFAGVGALFAVRLAAEAELPLPLVLLLAPLLTVPIGVIVALPAVRVRGVNLAIVTMGLAVALSSVVLANNSLIKGSPIGGVRQDFIVPRAEIFGYAIDELSHPERYAIFCLVVAVVMGLCVANVRRSGTGRRLLAVRDNERAALSLGINVAGTKLYAFALAAELAAVAGVLVTYRNQTVEFSQFDLFGSIEIILLGVLGGIGSLAGAVVGGALASAAAIDQIVSGLIEADTWLPLVAPALMIASLAAQPDGAMTAFIVTVQHHRRHRATAEAVEEADEAELVVERVPPKRLEARDVTLAFGPTTVLDGISLSVEPGQIVGLIGPNGAGKTTFIDAACGFHRRYRGTFTLDGTPLDRSGPASRSSAGITRSFQSVELFDDLSVEENLRIASEHLRWFEGVTDLFWPRRRPLNPLATMAIDVFELRPLLHEKPPSLSHAQRRVVSIARAVASGPSILLLDEPAAGLDEASRAELVVIIRRLAAEFGLGVLLVEHDVQLVMDLCDIVVGIDRGRVIATGPPAAVRDNPALVASYLGTSHGPEHAREPEPELSKELL